MAGNEAPPFWNEPVGWQARVLSPLAFAYGRIARWRLIHAKPPAVGAPVLCIGNLTVGGTGKTPTALALCEEANAKGLKPGFLTRGYGGSHAGPHLVDVQNDTARSVGDEPLLLARAAPTMVAHKRAAGAQALIDGGCDFIIMDDGFQSRSIHYDHAVITLDARRGIGNGQVLPAGPLRAPLVDQMRHCDAVLRIGLGTAGDAVIRAASRAAKPLMRAEVQAEYVKEINGKNVLAYTGIGDPQKFYDTLETVGCHLSQTQSFGDHHKFSEADAQSLLATAEAEQLRLVTTEKDFVRLSHETGPLAELKQRTHVLPVKLVFENKTDPGLVIDRTIDAYDLRRAKTG